MFLTITFFDFTLGVLSSLIASFVFIFSLLFFLRPRIKISSNISRRTGFFEDKEKITYMFKVINLSWFSAYDVSIELNCLESYPVKDGMNFRFTPLQMRRSKINFIPYFRPNWLKKKYGEYAMIFVTQEDLATILEDEKKSIQLQITLRHGVTGLSKVYNMDYAHHTLIKNGHFQFGNSFNII